MRKIKLTQNSFATVDDDDYEVLSKYSWRNHNGYAARTTLITEGKRTTMLMHRQIVGEIPRGMDVDHINGDKADNRKENLRVVTRLQNMHNSPKRNKNTSGYKGVGFDKAKQKWRSRLIYRNKEVWLGYFDCKHEAARAYNQKASELFGEYARLNEINEKDAI